MHPPWLHARTHARAPVHTPLWWLRPSRHGQSKAAHLPCRPARPALPPCVLQAEYFRYGHDIVVPGKLSVKPLEHPKAGDRRQLLAVFRGGPVASNPSAPRLQLGAIPGCSPVHPGRVYPGCNPVCSRLQPCALNPGCNPLCAGGLVAALRDPEGGRVKRPNKLRKWLAKLLAHTRGVIFSGHKSKEYVEELDGALQPPCNHTHPACNPTHTTHTAWGSAPSLHAPGGRRALLHHPAGQHAVDPPLLRRRGARLQPYVSQAATPCL